MGPCIANVFSNTMNKMQCYTIYLFIYLFLWSALHVSGDSSAHYQELKLYIQQQVLCQTFTASCHCRGRDGTQEFQKRWNSRVPSLPRQWKVAVKVWQSTRCCIYSLSSLWWVEEPPETCRAFHRNK